MVWQFAEKDDLSKVFQGKVLGIYRSIDEDYVVVQHRLEDGITLCKVCHDDYHKVNGKCT